MLFGRLGFVDVFKFSFFVWGFFFLDYDGKY